MSKCVSCRKFKEGCQQRYGRDPSSTSCPELIIQLCSQCAHYDFCSSKDGILPSTEACGDFENNGKDPLYDSIKTYFENDVLPAIKNGTYVEDPSVIDKISKLTKMLGSIVNKPEPEDTNIERTLMDIIYEDFETDRALNSATLTINQILQSEGVNVPFNQTKLNSVAQAISELKLIYKLSLAYGLAAYVDVIMKQSIATKFGTNPGQIRG